MPLTSVSSALTSSGSVMRHASPVFRSRVRSPDAATTSISAIVSASTVNTFCFCAVSEAGSGRFIS